MEDCLNEVYPLPYFFDIIQYNKITNENLINHIDSQGKIIYTKKLIVNKKRMQSYYTDGDFASTIWCFEKSPNETAPPKKGW